MISRCGQTEWEINDQWQIMQAHEVPIILPVISYLSVADFGAGLK